MPAEGVSASVAVIARAINSGIVLRGATFADRPFPRGPAGGARDKSTTDAATWRGGGFSDTAVTRAFFVPGKKFRAPQFLATSFNRRVATGFMEQATMSGPVNARTLWKIRLDRGCGCEHVTLVTNTHVRGELEYLFTAFSVFTVEVVNWSANPTKKATPHEITIVAAVDNRVEPEDLPLAPRC